MGIMICATELFRTAHACVMEYPKHHKQQTREVENLGIAKQRRKLG